MRQTPKDPVIPPLPAPPYWLVSFVSQSSGDQDGYADMAARMVELAKENGCLAFISTRSAEGLGIALSFWPSLDTIKAWGRHPEHLKAQSLGRTKWYDETSLVISKVES